jgi:twitching motility protein PilT
MLRWFTSIAPPHAQKEFAEKKEVDIGHAVAGCGRFRINAFMQREHVGMVLRHIPATVQTIAEMELPEVLESLAAYHRGMVLVTGATGSGKSTTLAAIIEHINRTRPVHIITVEDPIEFVFTDQKAIVNQRQVGVDTTGFAPALRAALRQDPDVILIGELRDLETVETAIHAAETGHLVLATLHTTDAMETIARVIGLFPSHQQNQIRLQLASIIRAIVSQRLVRTIAGGRTAACEIMIATQFIKDLIADPRRTHEIPEAIKLGEANYGTQTFDQALIKLLEQERITVEEALANATNAAEVKLHTEGFG